MVERPSRAAGRSWLLCVAAACLWRGAWAQRAEQNLVTEAEDAFGTAVGQQSIGLYSLNDARGFNPQQAGNLRIEGLYFDQPSPYLNDCLVSGTTMRIGIAAQSYSFPAPTGIADLKLFAPSNTPGASALMSGGSYAERVGFFQGQTPVTSHLAASACIGFARNFMPDLARSAANAGMASVLRWHPDEQTQVLPFIAHFGGFDHGVLPVVYTDGVLPPPLFNPHDLASQPTTRQDWRSTTSGVIVRHVFDARWSLAAGLFHVQDHNLPSAIEEYLSVLPNRTADHELDQLPTQDNRETSGEVRATARFGNAKHQQTLKLSARGRRADRQFGGDTLYDYGLVTLESPPPTQAVNLATSPVSLDQTRQLDGGVEFEDRIHGMGSVGVGLLRSSYRRTVANPGTAPSSQTATPWLPHIRATWQPALQLTLYASYLQGLEDSALAPSSAINRGEPPPATRTRQSDGGLRLAGGEHLTLILGAFDIEKVYFNSDAANRYRALGTVRHRGLESSLTYSRNGFTVVAGGVLLRAHVDRVIPEPGATGLYPLGPVPLLLNVNLDLAPAKLSPFAASLQWMRFSERVATADDRYELPVLGLLNAGLRLQGRAWRHPCSLRFDVANVTNTRGLMISPVEVVTSMLGRRYRLSVAVDT